MDSVLKDDLSVFDAHWHEAWDGLCEEANWKSMQAYANHWLRWGLEREAIIMEKSRHQRRNWFRQSVAGRRESNKSGIRIRKQRELK